MVATISYVL